MKIISNKNIAGREHIIPKSQYRIQHTNLEIHNHRPKRIRKKKKSKKKKKKDHKFLILVAKKTRESDIANSLAWMMW